MPETEEVHLESDQLPKDLSKIVDESMFELMDKRLIKDRLMEKLVIYIVARDHKIHDHAYKLGKDQK